MGRRAEQNAQAMTRLPKPRVELRERRFGFSEAGCGLLDVEFSRDPILEPFPCQSERFLLDLNVYSCEFDSLFIAT
jgi:hypothetical protein